VDFSQDLEAVFRIVQVGTDFRQQSVKARRFSPLFITISAPFKLGQK
jgi:hypothetical protein